MMMNEIEAKRRTKLLYSTKQNAAFLKREEGRGRQCRTYVAATVPSSFSL
jgi:hypothetical protein